MHQDRIVEEIRQHRKTYLKNMVTISIEFLKPSKKQRRSQKEKQSISARLLCSKKTR